jgi:hypothetical protein
VRWLMLLLYVLTFVAIFCGSIAFELYRYHMFEHMLGHPISFLQYLIMFAR